MCRKETASSARMVTNQGIRERGLLANHTRIEARCVTRRLETSYL